MINRKPFDKFPYPIAIFLEEIIVCAVLFFFCCILQNLVPPFVSSFVDNLTFDLSRFSDAIISLNVGLIFAVFLLIFSPTTALLFEMHANISLLTNR